MKVIARTGADGKLEVQSVFSDNVQIATVAGEGPIVAPQEKVPGKEWKPYLDPNTNTIYWELVDREITAEDKVILLEALTQQQEQRIALMQAAIDDLILNSGGGL